MTDSHTGTRRRHTELRAEETSFRPGYDHGYVNPKRLLVYSSGCYSEVSHKAGSRVIGMRCLLLYDNVPTVLVLQIIFIEVTYIVKVTKVKRRRKCVKKESNKKVWEEEKCPLL